MPRSLPNKKLLTQQDLESLIGTEILFLEIREETRRGMEALAKQKYPHHKEEEGIGYLAIIYELQGPHMKILQFGDVRSVSLDDGTRFPRVTCCVDRPYIFKPQEIRGSPQDGYSLQGTLTHYQRCCGKRGLTIPSPATLTLTEPP